MTRIDLSTREWHELIKPVIPHTAADKDFPYLAHIRLDATPPWHLHAVASDRYTLATETIRVDDGTDGVQAMHITKADAAASLAMFRYSKDDNPALRLTIDTAPVLSDAAALFSVDHLALTITAPDGTKLVMRDRRDPYTDHLAPWRGLLRAAMARATAASPAMSLMAGQFARWAGAARPGELITALAGRTGQDSRCEPVVVLAGDHFAGLWIPQAYPAEPAKLLAESPLWGLLECEDEDGYGPAPFGSPDDPELDDDEAGDDE